MVSTLPSDKIGLEVVCRVGPDANERGDTHSLNADRDRAKQREGITAPNQLTNTTAGQSSERQ